MTVRLQKLKTGLISILSTQVFIDEMVSMIDEIRANENASDQVTPFFSQAELLEIGDFYADQEIMQQIISTSVNRAAKYLAYSVGLVLAEPNTFAKYVQIKESLLKLEIMARDKLIATCVKRYGQPSNYNKARRDELMARMQAAEAQFERDVRGSKLH